MIDAMLGVPQKEEMALPSYSSARTFAYYKTLAVENYASHWSYSLLS